MGDSNLEAIGKLIEEFIDDVRAGKQPDIESFANRDPAIATQIRNALSAVLMIENPGQPGHQNAQLKADNVFDRQPAPAQIGEFQIIRELGRGGMGCVYEAVQSSLDRRVALKVLNIRGELKDQFFARFQVEAHAAANLHHTNIVPVFQVGESDGHVFYAMQLIEGNSLEKVIKFLGESGLYELDSSNSKSSALKNDVTIFSDVTTDHVSSTDHHKPLRKKVGVDSKSSTTLVDQKISICNRQADLEYATPAYFRIIAGFGLAAADALAHAHDKRVLHRDIKPANLILDRESNIWLTDFGLAKYQDSDLTQTGQVVGTLRYMAPERLIGEGDHRADIYSLGLTLYELVTLEPAFADSDQAALIGKINREPVADPVKRCPQLPSDLNAIIRKTVQREPELRYQSAADLADDLQRFVEGRPIEAQSISSFRKLKLWSRRNPVVASLLGAVFLLMIILTVGAVISSLTLNEKNLEISRRFENEKKLRAESDQQLLNASLSAFEALSVSKENSRQEKMIQQISVIQELNESREDISIEKRRLRDMYINAVTRYDLKETRRVPLKDQHINPDNDWGFSSDLSLLARIDIRGQFQIVSVKSQRVMKTLSANWQYGKTRFGPNDKFVCIHGVDQNLETTFAIYNWRNGERIFKHRGSTDEGLRGSFGFSANGARVAFRDETNIYVYDFNSDDLVLSLKTLGAPWLALSPDGTQLVYARFDGVVLYDVDQNKQVDVYKGVATSLVGCWSPFPNYFAAGSGDGTIVIWDIANNAAPFKKLHGHSSEIESLSFHPDGTMLVSSSREGKTRIWKRGFTELEMPKGGMQFSRSGNEIAFFDDETAYGIWSVQGVPPREFSISPVPAQQSSFSMALADNTLAWASRGIHLPLLNLDTFQMQLIPTPDGNDDTVVMQVIDQETKRCPIAIFASKRIVVEASKTSEETAKTEWELKEVHRYENWGQRIFPVDQDSMVIIDQQNSFELRNNSGDVKKIKTDWWCGAAAVAKEHIVVTSKSEPQFMSVSISALKSGNPPEGMLHLLELNQPAVPLVGPGNRIAFSSNGLVLVHDIIGSFESELIATLQLQGSDAFCRAAFSNDGTFLAITSYKQILLFRTSDWAQIAAIPAPSNVVLAGTVMENSIDIKFTQGDQYLVCGTTAGSIIVWDFDDLLNELEDRQLGFGEFTN